MLAYVRRHVPEPRTAPLCGSTPSFDRGFLRVEMPELEAHFHYRHVDVSTIGELARRWYPVAYATGPGAGQPKPHRALPDILASIELLRHYRATVFRHPLVPEPT